MLRRALDEAENQEKQQHQFHQEEEQTENSNLLPQQQHDDISRVDSYDFEGNSAIYDDDDEDDEEEDIATPARLGVEWARLRGD